MKLIVTTESRATVQESYVIEVPDETDFTSDDGYGEVADAFFATLADGESFVKIESHGMVGAPEIHGDTEIMAIEGEA